MEAGGGCARRAARLRCTGLSAPCVLPAEPSGVRVLSVPPINAHRARYVRSRHCTSLHVRLPARPRLPPSLGGGVGAGAVWPHGADPGGAAGGAGGTDPGAQEDKQVTGHVRGTGGGGREGGRGERGQGGGREGGEGAGRRGFEGGARLPSVTVAPDMPLVLLLILRAHRVTPVVHPLPCSPLPCTARSWCWRRACSSRLTRSCGGSWTPSGTPWAGRHAASARERTSQPAREGGREGGREWSSR